MRPSVVYFVLSLTALANEVTTLSSPDGKVQFRIAVQENGQLAYSVTLNAKPVLETSAVAMIVDGVNLGQGVQTGKIGA